MMKIKLQLFAQKLNTDTSIVDLLKSKGMDSSYDARKKLAGELGIANYTGTADQNISMIKKLSGGSDSNTGTTGSTSSGNTSGGYASRNSYFSGNTFINGVDQATIDKMNSTYKQSDKVSNAQKKADKSRDKVTSLAEKDHIIDQDTMDAINKPYQESASVTQAFNYTNQLLEKLSTGRTSYTDQVRDLMHEIQNRDKFEYDVDSDTLFQQALASAMSSGKTAMQDTIGQASALTGGYGSTYATTAGNQAYNAYIQDAYNNLPEYYQMALEAYQMEGQEMYNQLAMLNDADATEYQRMYDSWSANFSNAQQMYEREYGQWQDSVTNAFNSANLQLNEHSQIFDQAYKAYTAEQENANTLYAQEYQKWADEVNNAFNFAGLANSDYWNNANFNEGVRQFNANMAQRQSEFSAEMGYKYSSLAQDQAQFNARYDANGDGVVDSKDKNAGSELKEPTSAEMSKALEAYNTGGDNSLDQYVDTLGGNIDIEKIYNYIYGDESSGTQGYGTLPLEKRTYTKTKDTVNGMWGVDHNDIVVDQYGNEYKISDLPDELREELTKLTKGQSYTAK